MKFKVSLGPRTRAWKFPYLTVQVSRPRHGKWNCRWVCLQRFLLLVLLQRRKVCSGCPTLFRLGTTCAGELFDVVAKTKVVY